MLAWENGNPPLIINLLLFVVATLSCLLIASRFSGLLSWPSRPTVKAEAHGRHVRILDGNHLYYDRAPWPIYDAKFNLKLSQLYGPIVIVNQGPKGFLHRLCRLINGLLFPTWWQSDTTVLINSFRWGEEKHLERLLKESTSRAPSIAAGQYLSRGKRIVLMPYGAEWKQHRKAFARLVTRRKIKTEWATAVQFEALMMVSSLKNNPVQDNKVVEEISRFTASSVLQITYARRAATLNDAILRDLEVVSKNMASAFTSGNYLVDSFPLLGLLPESVSPWKRKLNADHAFELSVFSGLLQSVEASAGKHDTAGRQQESDIVVPVDQCAAAQLLQNDDMLDREDVAYLAAGFFEAGTETTAMSIAAFLLGAVASRKLVELAQAEISKSMSGREFAPDFEDVENFSSGYVSGFVREALRLTPTCSSGMAHTTTKQAWYFLNADGEGGDEDATRLDIPTGATVLANIYGLHHDPEVYPDPWSFDPSRWLESPQTTVDYTYACSAFGFGKRRCPGSGLACYSMSMAIVLLLWCFDFEFKEDVAREICAEMERKERDKHEKWERTFSKETSKDKEVSSEQEDGSSGPLTTEAAMHRTLMDAYTTFRISGAQVSKCVRLIPRSSCDGGDPFGKIERTLARIRGKAFQASHTNQAGAGASEDAGGERGS